MTSHFIPRKFKMFKTTIVILLFTLLQIINARIVPKATCPPIVTREEWNARPPNEIQQMELPVSYIVIHHTVMGEGECNTREECIKVMQDIQNLHIDTNGWADIGYSFLIGGDGAIYMGRGWDRVGAHSPGYNDKSFGISVIGNFMEHLPNEAQLNKTLELISCALNVLNYLNDNYTLYGHRDVRETECPGDKFYDEISTWPQFHYEGVNKFWNFFNKISLTYFYWL